MCSAAPTPAGAEHLCAAAHGAPAVHVAIDPRKQQVRETIVRRLGVPLDQVQFDVRLTYELGADSFASTELCLEQEFAITIPDEDQPALATVGAIVGYLQQCRARALTRHGTQSHRSTRFAKPRQVGTHLRWRRWSAQARLGFC